MPHLHSVPQQRVELQGLAAARRWSIRGWIPDTDWKCTSLLDLSPSTEHVLVHLAGTSQMKVTIDRSGIEKLLTAVRTGNACAIPAHHDVHGERLLCLRPEERPDEPLWTDTTTPTRSLSAPAWSST